MCQRSWLELRGYLIAWVKVTAYHPTTSLVFSLSSCMCTVYTHKYIYTHTPLLARCTVCLDRTSASSVEILIRNGTGGGGNFSTASLHRLSRYVVLARFFYRTFALRNASQQLGTVLKIATSRCCPYLERVREKVSVEVEIVDS